MKDSKRTYYKSQAVFTIYFDSDFEPSILNKILGVNASKIVLKKNAVRNQSNPKALGFYQLSTNVACDRETEVAIATVLRVFIKKEDEVNKIVKENKGFCKLDLFVKQSKDGVSPDINLSQNAIKLLSDLHATFSVNLLM